MTASLGQRIYASALFIAGRIAQQDIIPVYFPCHRLNFGFQFVVTIAEHRYDGQENHSNAQEHREIGVTRQGCGEIIFIIFPSNVISQQTYKDTKNYQIHRLADPQVVPIYFPPNESIFPQHTEVRFY